MQDFEEHAITITLTFHGGGSGGVKNCQEIMQFYAIPSDSSRFLGFGPCMACRKLHLISIRQTFTFYAVNVDFFYDTFQVENEGCSSPWGKSPGSSIFFLIFTFPIPIFFWLLEMTMLWYSQMHTTISRFIKNQEKNRW